MLRAMIQKLCPNGVLQKTIGESCNVFTGGDVPEGFIKEKKPSGEYIYPVYSNGIGENAVYGYSKNYRIEKDAVTFSSIGTIGCPTLRKGKFTPIIRLKVIIPKDDKELLLPFLKYALEIAIFTSQKSSVPNINTNMVNQITIPIPPIPIQEEIVRVLDKFTLLKAELEAELEARTVQYEHYRNALMDFLPEPSIIIRGFFQALEEEYSLVEIEATTLGSIAQIGTGSGNRVDATENGDYPFFVRSKNVLKSSKFIFDEEAIIIPGEGSIGEIFHYINGKYNLHQRAYRVSFKEDSILTKYAYYYLHANFKKYIYTKAVTATVSSLRLPMIQNFPIVVPPLPVQEAIVDILDRFEAIVHDIQDGLPAEIALRQKQYEYYRDKLLTFEPLETQAEAA